MRQQYTCKNLKRRQQVRDSGTTLNGIDYLEVADLGAPDDLRQRVLELHFLKPHGISALTRDNFRIEGGERIRGIQVIGVRTEPSNDTLLYLDLNGWGDYSTYHLLLVDAENPSMPLTDFDLILARVDFSFKIDCPSNFDCPRPPPCEPETTPAPQLDYLAKDYASFRRLMLDRLSVTVPEWQERNAADAEIALVEVLAYAADHLSYYQDAVATEAYLGTARKRASVRRHARFLDYHMHEGCNARCWVCIDVAHDIHPLPGQRHVLPAGTMLLTRLDNVPRVRQAELQDRLTHRPLVFETMYGLASLLQKRNRITLYTWGDDACCLPKGATRATLLGSQAELALQAGDVLILEEVIGAHSGLSEDADPSHRHAVRLVKTPVEKTDPLNGETVLEVEWHRDDALPFPLCLWELDDGAGGSLPVSVARANVVLADHGRSFSYRQALTDPTPMDEKEYGLEPAVVPLNGHYRPRLKHQGITYSVAYTTPHDPTLSAMAALLQEPEAAQPVVTLYDGSKVWSAQRDLLNSGRFSNEFVVEMEDDDRAYLRFGDGILGKQPTGGTEFAASYRVGNGRVGNVGAEAISHIVTELDGVIRIRNPMAAQSGQDPEPIEQVRLYAPHAFRTQKRAVTEEDYARTAELFPGVQKAVATRRWTGSWYTMFITVDREGGLEVDELFERRLRRHMESYRLAGHDLEIDGPQFVSLDIAMSVCTKPGYFAADVKQALLEAFGTGILADGRRAFFHSDNFTFGQAVHLSRIITTAMQAPGVQWVDMEIDATKPHHRFQRWGEKGVDHVAKGRIEMQRLEIARLENNPNAPENGRIEFLMGGGA